MLCLETLELYSLLIRALYLIPKFGGRLIVIIEQGGIAKKGCNAMDRTINNITITIVFFYYKLKPYREIAKE